MQTGQAIWLGTDCIRSLGCILGTASGPLSAVTAGAVVKQWLPTNSPNSAWIMRANTNANPSIRMVGDVPGINLPTGVMVGTQMDAPITSVYRVYTGRDVKRFVWARGVCGGYHALTGAKS